MKKSVLFSLLLTFLCIGMSSCKKEAAIYHDYDGVVQDFTVGVDKIQALHRQTMFMTLNVTEFEWRNSKIVFSDSITTENIDSLHITNINDVFYYWSDKKGPQIQLINTNVEKGTQIPWPINDIWIEDGNLSEAPIKLTPEQALKRLKEVNCPIPPAKSMILRLPIGPVVCNPQYVIGDVYDVLFIDAVTGEINNWNPAFNPQKGVKGGDFGKPLGEWP